MPSSKKLRVGLAGCGGMGRAHVRALLAEPQVEVVAICDPLKSHTGAYQRELFRPAGQSPKVFSDYGRMLRAARLDAVVLATPHTVHYEQIVAALQRGVHVLVEKPMVTDSAHAREVLRRSQANGLMVQIAFQGPCSPEFAYIRNALRRGQIGQVQVVDTFVCQNWMRSTRRTWRQDPKLSGGGQLYDSGAHMLNAMIWFLQACPTEVYALGDYRGCAVDINSVVTVRFEDGCLGSITCLGNAVSMDHEISLYGTEGTLRTRVHGGRLEHIGRDGQPIKYPFVPYEPQTPVHNFINAIRGHDELRCPPRYGLLLAELMEAIYESMRTGGPARVEHFEAGAAETRRGRTKARRAGSGRR